MRDLQIIILFVAISTLFASSCSTAKFNVVKIDKYEEISDKEGFFYSLPRTQLDIDVTLTKIEEVSGPYAEFASKYLGLSNVISENSVEYELSEIQICQSYCPDPEQYYFVEMDQNKSGKAPEALIVFNEAGIIVNTTGSDFSENTDRHFVMPPEESNVYPDVFKYFSNLNLFEQVDTIIERVNIDTATIEKMVFRRTLVEKTPEQKAKDAADFIIKVKENRLNLISGYQEVNYDKETFTLMNDKLEKLETEYQKLFTGLTFTKTLKYRFSYMPDVTRPADSVSLFKFSKLRGILDATNLNGDLVYLKIQNSGDTKPVSNYINKKTAVKNQLHGYYYRIPEYAFVSIMLGNKTRINTKVLVSQFGPVTCLPSTNAGIVFYPSTGAVKEVEIQKTK